MDFNQVSNGKIMHQPGQRENQVIGVGAGFSLGSSEESFSLPPAQGGGMVLAGGVG